TCYVSYFLRHLQKVWILFKFGYLKKSKRLDFLRHTCASMLLSEGYGLKDVQEWLGHSDIKMTANIYGHLDIRRKRSIANGLEQALPRLKP
ncbi:MAG: tyrosine-type recombinase/integrase, partial [Subdoligranulum variabile]|nr:tyrosine-type recombinase/integrase [Subdoligranulum variabile]